MKFLSCNIEGNKHFERILPLLKRERPDVVALQEVFECDLAELQKATGLANYLFYPNAAVKELNDHLPPRGPWGIAIFADEIVEQQVTYYVRQAVGQLANFRNDRPDLIDRAALFARVRVGAELFSVLTTHFTWSGEGVVSEQQRRDYAGLRQFMAQFDELIFCGDLNTPRGHELWSDLAKRYRDNIPLDVDTTIDKNLHKSGQDIRLVIDGLFTSKHYSASKVQVLPGTSDHMAVAAELVRVS